MTNDIKKVYISADIEGMEGVVSRAQTEREKGDYELARKRFTLNINEAVKAAVDAGAEEILVCDGHADMENLLIDVLHPSADLISGAMRPILQMQGINEEFDAVILFGHAGAGTTIGGVLDHTFNGRRIYGLRINNINMNTEAVFNAMIAGYYGVPLAAIIGDSAVVSEVQYHIPSCEGIIVKEGISRYSARSIHPTRARELIYNGVLKALKRSNSMEPFKIKEPLTMEIDFITSAGADVAELVPGVQRLSPRTISYIGDAESIFKLHTLLIFRVLEEYPFNL